MFWINGTPLNLERFPDGTQRLKVSPQEDEISLQWHYEKDEEMTLFFIVSHLRNWNPQINITLDMPYIPHARMDRVKDPSEVFTLKYFCDFINKMYFNKVLVRDAHSHVALALLDRVVSQPITPYINSLISDLINPIKDIVFFPDEGSAKRYSESIKVPYAFGIKERDWRTGHIQNLEIHGTIPSAPFNALIIDDIASYGGTFLHSAKKLKALGANKIYLYITHCENSILNGDLIKSGLLERIYTTKGLYTAHHPLIEIIGD